MIKHKRLIATVWDDGLTTDLQLLDILKQYHVRASFAFSPGVYAYKPTLNDSRSEAYGYRLSKSDLLKFQDHDICNHTFSHEDITLLTGQQASDQIRNGRTDLQRLFRQEVYGFVYPYGEWNSQSQLYVYAAGHKYSRVTSQSRITGWSKDIASGRVLVPDSGWQQEIAPYLDNDFMLLSGHTYQMKSKEDWQHVAAFYDFLTGLRDTRVVTMTELAIAMQMKHKYEQS